MACERPKRIPNPRYAPCIGATNFDKEKSYDGVTIQDYCEEYFGYRGRPPDEFIDVPCGRCYSCTRSRLNSWRIRLLAEVNDHPNSIFVTLTFNDYYLNHFKDNPNRAISLFLDRVRKKYGKQIRHFFIPEFGTLHGRLHYHGILFDAPYKTLDCTPISQEWKYGFVYLGWCNEKTCNYIVKYITKDAPPGQKLPRIVASKGLGLSYIKEYGQDLKSNKSTILNNGKYIIPLPRYYTQKIFTVYERAQMLFENSLLPFERFVDGKKYNDYPSYRLALSRYCDKQISIGLSPQIEKRPLSELYKRELSSNIGYLTPFDVQDENSFELASPPYHYHYILLHDNVYHRVETPF